MGLRFSMRRTSRRLGIVLATSVTAAMTLVFLPAATSSATGTQPAGGSSLPQAGTGSFAGIYPWGEGAQACTPNESDRTSKVLVYDCDGLKRNFIGSYVVFRFPTKNFNVNVQLAKGSQDYRQGLNWYEQGTTTVPEVFKFGVIHGSEAVNINGQNVPFENTWDLGLDKSFGTYAGLPATVDAVITITLIQG